MICKGVYVSIYFERIYTCGKLIKISDVEIKWYSINSMLIRDIASYYKLPWTDVLTSSISCQLSLMIHLDIFLKFECISDLAITACSYCCSVSYTL